MVSKVNGMPICNGPISCFLPNILSLMCTNLALVSQNEQYIFYAAPLLTVTVFSCWKSGDATVKRRKCWIKTVHWSATCEEWQLPLINASYQPMGVGQVVIWLVAITHRNEEINRAGEYVRGKNNTCQEAVRSWWCGFISMPYLINLFHYSM